MKGKFLSPGVEDGNDPGFSTKELLIRTQRKERFLYTPELQTEEPLLIRLNKGVQFMRHSKDYMKVSDPFDQLGVAFQLPLLFQWSLTAGTGTVVAGYGMDYGKAAVLTVTDVVTEFSGLAAHDGRCCLPLFLRQGRMKCKILRIKAPEDLADRVISRSHTGFSHSFRCRCRGTGRLPWRREIYAPLLP